MRVRPWLAWCIAEDAAKKSTKALDPVRIVALLKELEQVRVKLLPDS